MPMKLSFVTSKEMWEEKIAETDWKENKQPEHWQGRSYGKKIAIMESCVGMACHKRRGICRFEGTGSCSLWNCHPRGTGAGKIVLQKKVGTIQSDGLLWCGWFCKGESAEPRYPGEKRTRWFVCLCQPCINRASYTAGTGSDPELSQQAVRRGNFWYLTYSYLFRRGRRSRFWFFSRYKRKVLSKRSPMRNAEEIWNHFHSPSTISMAA